MRLHEQMPELRGATTWLNDQYERADLVGRKPTLIHFWSISCKLCKEMMPNVNYLRDRYRGELHVIAVHMPRSDDDMDVQQIKRIAAIHDVTQPIFVDGDLKLIRFI